MYDTSAKYYLMDANGNLSFDRHHYDGHAFTIIEHQ